ERGGAWTIAPLLFSFGLIPLLDAVLEQNRVNLDDAEGHLRVFDVPLLAWIPVQLATTAYVLWGCVHGQLTSFEVAGLVVSLGIINGAGGINIAHELM